MVNFPKISPLLPAVLIIIVVLFIVHNRVRAVDARNEELATSLGGLRKEFDAFKVLSGAGECKEGACAAVPSASVRPAGWACVIEEMNDAEEGPVAPAATRVLSEPTTESELMELLKTVDQIHDAAVSAQPKTYGAKATSPQPLPLPLAAVTTKKAVMEEEKLIKAALRHKGLSCKGTIEELRARLATETAV
jgi:hypothetical protein